MQSRQLIIEAIDGAPLNRGLRGVDWVARPENVPIVMGEDIALFDYEEVGEYQIHLLYSVARGRQAIERTKDAFSRMFKDHGAELIFALIPNFRRDVKLLARWLKLKFVGLRATVHGICELFIMTKNMWDKLP